MAKTVTLRLEKDAYDELQEEPAAQRRPLATLIATTALARIREEQFADDEEMAEILGNDALLRRLKGRLATGSPAEGATSLHEHRIPLPLSSALPRSWHSG